MHRPACRRSPPSGRARCTSRQSRNRWAGGRRRSSRGTRRNPVGSAIAASIDGHISDPQLEYGAPEPDLIATVDLQGGVPSRRQWRPLTVRVRAPPLLIPRSVRSPCQQATSRLLAHGDQLCNLILAGVSGVDRAGSTSCATRAARSMWAPCQRAGKAVSAAPTCLGSSRSPSRRVVRRPSQREPWRRLCRGPRRSQIRLVQGAARARRSSIARCRCRCRSCSLPTGRRSDAASLPTAVLDCHERRPLLRHQLRRAAASLKETGSWHFSGLKAVHAAVEARPGSGARPRPTGGGSPLMSGPCPLAPVIHRTVS